MGRVAVHGVETERQVGCGTWHEGRSQHMPARLVGAPVIVGRNREPPPSARRVACALRPVAATVPITRHERNSRLTPVSRSTCRSIYLLRMLSTSPPPITANSSGRFFAQASPLCAGSIGRSLP